MEIKVMESEDYLKKTVDFILDYIVKVGELSRVRFPQFNYGDGSVVQEMMEIAKLSEQSLSDIALDIVDKCNKLKSALDKLIGAVDNTTGIVRMN